MGDSATHTCYLNLIQTNDAAKSMITGLYEDTLVKVDGQWRFSSRTVTADG